MRTYTNLSGEVVDFDTGEVVGRADRLPPLFAAGQYRGDGEADDGQHDRGTGKSTERGTADHEGLAAGHRLAFEVAARLGRRELGSRVRPACAVLFRFVCHWSGGSTARTPIGFR